VSCSTINTQYCGSESHRLSRQEHDSIDKHNQHDSIDKHNECGLGSRNFVSETLDAGIQNHMANRSSKSPSCCFLSDSPSLPPLPIVLKFYGIGCYDVGLAKSSVCVKIISLRQNHQFASK